MFEKNFIALDLEMNSPIEDENIGKIIQVGIAIGNLNSYINKKDFIEKSWYVNPYEKISPRITELTGITDEDVREKSTDIEHIYKEIQYLINENMCNPNPVVWGKGDAELFKTTVKEYSDTFHIFGHREIDVKTIFTFFQLASNKKTNSSLKTGLGSYKLQFKGIPHRAMDDARNTLILFFEMLNRQKSTMSVFNEISELI